MKHWGCQQPCGHWSFPPTATIRDYLANSKILPACKAGCLPRLWFSLSLNGAQAAMEPGFQSQGAFLPGPKRDDERLPTSRGFLLPPPLHTVTSRNTVARQKRAPIASQCGAWCALTGEHRGPRVCICASHTTSDSISSPRSNVPWLWIHFTPSIFIHTEARVVLDTWTCLWALSQHSATGVPLALEGPPLPGWAKGPHSQCELDLAADKKGGNCASAAHLLVCFSVGASYLCYV